MLSINRLAPTDQRVEIGFEGAMGKRRVCAVVRRLADGGLMGEGDCLSATEGTLHVRRLFNGEDYEVTVTALDEKGRVRETSAPWRFQCGYVPGRVVGYRHPFDPSLNPAGRFLGTPSIARLHDGTLLASHDMFFWDPLGNYKDIDFSACDMRDQRATRVYRSTDNGESWSFLAHVRGCMFGKLFEHRGKVYLYARASHGEDGKEIADLGVFCSTDGGAHWSEPCILAHGAPGLEYHKSSTPLLETDGRLWTTYDSPLNGTTGRGIGMVSLPVDADLMDASSWTVAPPCYYRSDWKDAVPGEWNYMMEEANLVKTPDGALKIMVRYNAVCYEGTAFHRGLNEQRAVMLDFDKAHPEKSPTFECFTPFIGSLAKFTIRYDEASRKYYALVNRVTNSKRFQRELLTLTSSPDLYHWRTERDLLNLADAQWPEDCHNAAFSYCDWLFDGDDIIAVSRTALHHAISQHDNNYLTFHRFRNFRDEIHYPDETGKKED